MLTTTNYGLKKPEGNDVVNIDDLNYNADVIDTKLKEINTNLPLKAPLASPAFTGVPTAPTANNGTNNTQVATTAFVNNALSPINTSLSEKADNIDNFRTTVAKDVTGAINELNANKPTIETGTWTPVFKGTTVAGSNTYSQQFARYTKQGKLVTCYFRLEISVKDSAMNGNIVIGGLPYTAFNINANRAGLVIANLANITLASGCSQLCGEIIPNDSSISLIAVGSNTYGVAITAADIKLAVIHGSITYESNF
jgi:hypothetical protein